MDQQGHGRTVGKTWATVEDGEFLPFKFKNDGQDLLFRTGAGVVIPADRLYPRVVKNGRIEIDGLLSPAIKP